MFALPVMLLMAITASFGSNIQAQEMYKTKMRWPSTGKINWRYKSATNYSDCSSTLHNGIDIAPNPEDVNDEKGREIYPAAEGQVVEFLYQADVKYGLVMKHLINGETFYTHYYHMAKASKNETLVNGSLELNKTYGVDTLLGYQGNRSGANDDRSVHLHFVVSSEPSRCTHIDPTWLYKWSIGPTKSLKAGEAGEVDQGYWVNRSEVFQEDQAGGTPHYNGYSYDDAERNVFLRASGTGNPYLVAERDGTNNVNANRSAGGEWEKMIIKPLGPNTVAIRNTDNNYLGAYMGSNDFVYCYAKQVGSWETWKINYHDYSIRANSTLADPEARFDLVPISGWDLYAGSQNQGHWERFEILGNPSSGTVGIKSVHGLLLGNVNGGEGVAAVGWIGIGAWEKFTLEQVPAKPGKYRIKSNLNGKYITATGYKNGPAKASVIEPKDWEEFTMITDSVNSKYKYFKTAHDTYLQVRPGKVAVKTKHKTFLQAVGGGGGEVNNNGVAVGNWETFTMEGLSDYTSRVSLRSSNNWFLSAVGSGGGALTANVSVLGEWEKFEFNLSLTGYATFRARNGQYVKAGRGFASFQTNTGNKFMQAQGGGGSRVNAMGGAVGSWEKWIVEPR
jgi:hypothetical protein